jgi:phage shock protein E
MKILIKFSLILQLISNVSFANTSKLFLDVRTPQEYSEEHVKEALNIDVANSNFEEKVNLLNKEIYYYVYCRSGRRSAAAIEKMKTLGFKQLENAGSLENAKKIKDSLK